MRALPALLLAMALLAACTDAPGVSLGQPGGAPPAQEPDITGVAVSRTAFDPITQDCVQPDAAMAPHATVSSDDPPVCTDPDTDVLGSVHIEAPDGDAAVVTVLRSTTLLRTAGDTHEQVEFSALAEGQVVDAWFDGPVMESFPVQATAAALVITDGGGAPGS